MRLGEAASRRDMLVASTDRPTDSREETILLHMARIKTARKTADDS